MLAIADPDLDDGPRTNRSATTRMCAVSREVRPIDELIRFVVSPQGEVIPDLKRKLPGRGLWVSASRQAVAEAVRRNQFARGFKREVRAARDTCRRYRRPAGAQRDRSARHGRQGRPGRLRLRQGRGCAHRRGRPAALIHASDGAADGIRKLDAIARQNAGNDDESRAIPGRHGADVRTIGFGTGPVKCDTCCRCSRARRARRSCRAARPWSDTGWLTTTRLPALRPRTCLTRIRRNRLCGHAQRNKIRTAVWLIRKRLATRH